MGFNSGFKGLMWKNTVERGRLRTIIWRMGIACWIPNTTNTHSEYVILIAFPLQQLLHERISVLRHTYIASLVMSTTHIVRDLVHVLLSTVSPFAKLCA